MKIAIPADTDRALVCHVFGRTPFFAIKDTESGEITYVNNPAANAHGGAGAKAAQTVIDSGASVLITVRLGETAAAVLQAAGLKIMRAEAASIARNFEACEKGELKGLTQFHAGYHGGI